jgi:hypothetical protein
MKQILALVVVAGAVLVAPAAAQISPPDFDYDREFGVIARESLWQSAFDAGTALADVRAVRVRCYRDKSSFEESFERRAGGSAKRVVAYYAGGRDIHLRNGTCANIRLFFLGRHTLLTAGAYSILLHESLHRQGLVSERFTTCFANESVRWGALWFGFTENEALRARNLALAYTKQYAPPDYRMGKPNCLAMTRTTEWIELI